MKPTMTSSSGAFLQMRPSAEITSASSSPRAAHVITPGLAIGDLEGELLGELERTFNKALANGREHAWEAFVERASELASNLGVGDLDWLQRALSMRLSSLRATAALARALGVIAEARADFVPRATAMFERLAAHASPEIRSIVLEWAPELGPEAAARLAAKLAQDAHPAVRQAAHAVRSAR